MVENLENEQWKTVSGYEDLYQVSNHGKIKSLGNDKMRKEKILKPINNKKGYQRVQLCKDGKEKMFFVHRLVASAFIDNPNNYPFINHKDEVKANNHVDNLEWCDCKYNINYGTRNEKVSRTNSKQIIQLTLNGDYIKSWDSSMVIQRELGFNQGNISSCCSGRYKSAYGYKWAYA